MDKTATLIGNKTPKLFFTFKLAIFIFSLVGIGISAYLTYIHYHNTDAVCMFGTNCDVVLSSYYATMWDVPLSMFGLLMYIALGALCLWSLLAREDWQNLLDIGIYGIALSGIIFTGYLYYLEIYKIHAFCNWCISSSIVIAAILILSLVNLFGGREKLKESRSKRFKLSRYIRW